jgi:hypothetical protein
MLFQGNYRNGFFVQAMRGMKSSPKTAMDGLVQTSMVQLESPEF